MDKRIKDEIKKIEIPKELHQRVLLGVGKFCAETEIHKTKRRKIIFMQRMKISIGVFVIIFILLIGSSFVFPTVNNALAKTPFLNLLFNPSKTTNSIIPTIHKKLIKKDYHIENVQLDSSKKIITVNVNGTKHYFNEIKGNIEKETINILNSYELNAYKVKVAHYNQKNNINKLTEEQKNDILNANELEKAIMNDPRLQKYELLAAPVRINEVEKFIPIVIPVSETKGEEIKQIVNNIVRERNLEGFTIKVFSADTEKEKNEQKWKPIVSSINDGLVGKKELKVQEVRLSSSETSNIFLVKTNIKSTDSDADQIAHIIEREISQFMQSDEVASLVQDEPYKLIIYSSENKTLKISN